MPAAQAALRAAAALMLVCLALPVSAQNTPDYSTAPRFPGYSSDSGTHTDFDAFDFDIGNDKTKHVEGESWHMSYAIDEGKRMASPLELLRNYANLFKAHEGKIVTQNMSSGGGDATLMMTKDGAETWMHIGVNNDGAQYVLDIVETAPMEQKIAETADDMSKQLATAGRIAIYGIHFATAKADITPDSANVLAEVAKLLKADPSLNLMIEGHTDNVGAKPANLDLSKRRAAAVKVALAERGIAAARLSTDGFGDTNPVGDNKTEDGRAKNRRVELVKQ